MLTLVFLACHTPVKDTGAADGLDTAPRDTARGDSDDSLPIDTSPDSTDSGADSGDSGADSDADSGADSGGGDTDSGGGCVSQHAIVTDIDETLTTDDNEFLRQIADPDYDPAMRPDANTLMQAYAAKGYRIYYVTARGEGLFLLDGTNFTDASSNWLNDHAFPRADYDLYLADGIGALTNSDQIDYKTDVVLSLEAAGIVFDYAYGNAESDIEAYLNGTIPEDHIFMVGDLVGTFPETEDIPNEEAYTAHLAAWMASVPPAPCD